MQDKKILEDIKEVFKLNFKFRHLGGYFKKMKETENQINQKMTFAEVLEKYPYLSKVFIKYNLHCTFCPMAKQETIENGAKIHGIPAETLIKELNQEIKKYEKENLS